MGHKGYAANMEKRTIRSQGKCILRNAYLHGQGVKKNDARAEEIEDEVIHTNTTLDTYIRAWDRYCDWLVSNGITEFTIDGASTHIQAYADDLKLQPGKSEGSTMSAYSIRTNISGICKVCHKNSGDYDLPVRNRADIIRSRNPVKNDKNFSEKNNAEFISFCQTTGLRKNKELAELRGTDLREQNGIYYIHINCGKGGRTRDAEICGSDAEIRAVVDKMIAAGSDKVWATLPSNADVHGYRSDYAVRIYNKYARDISTITDKSEKYYCRGDMQGKIYDRKAMKIASENLGHSRISVIAEYYFR